MVLGNLQKNGIFAKNLILKKNFLQEALLWKKALYLEMLEKSRVRASFPKILPHHSRTFSIPQPTALALHLPSLNELSPSRGPYKEASSPI